MTDARLNSGFTLVEVMAVVLVVGLLAAMIGPSLLSGDNWCLSAASRQLASDIQYAQNHAIISQQPISITFDMANESYVLTNASGPLIHPITHRAYQVNLRDDRRFERIDLVAATFDGKSSVSFDELGAPDATGSVTLKTGAFTYEVEIQHATGQVAVTDGSS